MKMQSLTLQLSGWISSCDCPLNFQSRPHRPRYDDMTVQQIALGWLGTSAPWYGYAHKKATFSLTLIQDDQPSHERFYHFIISNICHFVTSLGTISISISFEKLDRSYTFLDMPEILEHAERASACGEGKTTHSLKTPSSISAALGIYFGC